MLNGFRGPDTSEMLNAFRGPDVSEMLNGFRGPDTSEMLNAFRGPDTSALSRGGFGTPSISLLVLLAASPLLSQQAASVVPSLLETTLFFLRLLGVLAETDRAVPGLLLLLTVVGTALALSERLGRR